MQARPQRSPVAGVRVIAVEQFGAGPWRTLQLSSLGAMVIKIEDPTVRGEVRRYVVPYLHEEELALLRDVQQGKRSVSLDLRHPSLRLAACSRLNNQMVFNNLRGDLHGRLGLTYEALPEVGSRIVCGALSGFGMTGPRAAQGAYDYVIQTRARRMSLTGEPSGPPTRSGLSLVDFSGATPRRSRFSPGHGRRS